MPPRAAPRASLSTLDAVAIVVGIVIGAGIFKTPSLVAGASPSASATLGAWVLGGVVSIIGALCYAELATTYPDSGGDYHYLHRAFGPRVSFFFAWARLSVIQTGSIALQAFLIGDYLTHLVPLGEHSSAIYAASAIAAVSLVNMWRVRSAASVQRALTVATVAGVCVVIVAGFLMAPVTTTPALAGTSGVQPALGLAMVFVLLTYGGWNEAAYLPAEMRGGPRAVLWTLGGSLAIITALYLLANAAYLRALGREGVARSSAVAADLLGAALGPVGAWTISTVIAVAALSTINATVFTGARSAYALGRDRQELSKLGQWHPRARAPRNALLAQGSLALALVGLGTVTRDGFATMVEYTAPVFWLFFLLVGLALFVLRRKDAHRARPFRVPLYPLTPAVFCVVGAYMLASSLLYTGVGALVGVMALASGVPVLWMARLRHQRSAELSTRSPHHAKNFDRRGVRGERREPTDPPSPGP